MSVIAAKKSNIYIAASNLFQVDIIDHAVTRWQIFEQKNIEKSSQQCVVLNKILYGTPLLLELFLNAAYEEYFLFDGHFDYFIPVWYDCNASSTGN